MPVDGYCKGCIYLVSISTGKCCNYFEVKHERRGCPAGNGCKRRAMRPGKRPSTQLAPIEKPAAARSTPKTVAEESKGQRRTALTPEEAYERDKARVKQKAIEYREKAQGRQRAALADYKQRTGDSNYQISLKIGISESTVRKWCIEYKPANWEKLAILGIKRPEGL